MKNQANMTPPEETNKALTANGDLLCLTKNQNNHHKEIE